MNKKQAILETLKGKWVSQCKRCNKYHKADDPPGMYDDENSCWFVCECEGHDLPKIWMEVR